MKLVKLSEVCSFSRGLTYSKSDEVDFSSNIVLRANNIDLTSNSLNLEDLRYIKDSIQIKKEKIAKKNSLIICTASGSKSHVGKVALINEDYGYAFGGFMGQLTPSDKCHPKFLYYVLTSGLFKDFLMSLNDGTNINNLKFSDIENYEIPLPSLEKQREIVEKLDKAFADIESIRVQIKKQSDSHLMLKEGLIDQLLNGNSDDFLIKKLKDVTSKIGSGATPRGGEESYKLEGISLIRSLNVYDDGFRVRKLARIDDVQAQALSNVEVQMGDILLNITGASIARTCIAPEDYLPARVNQHVSIIRPKSEIILSEYLHYLLRSQNMKNKLLGVGNEGGSTRQALTKVDIENTVIRFPSSIEHQKEIIEELDSIVELSGALQNNLLKMEFLYSNLLSSLLASTFEEAAA